MQTDIQTDMQTTAAVSVGSAVSGVQAPHPAETTVSTVWTWPVHTLYTHTHTHTHTHTPLPTHRQT